MARSRVAPLNVDQRLWALEELARLNEENVQLQAENEALKRLLENVKPPHGPPDEASYKPGEGDV
jgi:regulator of replication initiation timing